MTAVADDGAVFHHGKVLPVDDADVAGGGDEYVADFRRFEHGHHTVAVHDRFQRAQGIDFSDDHVGAQAGSPQRDATAAPAIASHDDDASRQENVGRPYDAVDGALARAIAIVEEVFGGAVINGDHGKAQSAVIRHRAQANDAGGGFLCAAHDFVQDLAPIFVDRADEVGAIIHCDMWFVIERRMDVFVIGLVVLALDGINRNLVVRH